MQINRANDYQLETQFAKEGDYNGRELVVQITNAGEVKNQSGVSLNLGWKHNDAGNSGLDSFSVVDVSKGVFKITYPTEMLIPGDITAVIQVIENGKITLTRNFNITVERSPMDEDAIVSENSFSVLQEALLKVNNWDREFQKKYDELEATYATQLANVTDTLATTKKFTKNATMLQNTIRKMVDKHAVNIAIISDSTGASLNIYANNGNPGTTNPAYYNVVRDNLRAFYDNELINTINMSVGGRSAKAAVENIADYETEDAVDLYIIVFGINDANPEYNGGQTIEEFKQNMSTLTEFALNKDAEVLLMSQNTIYKTEYDRPKRQKYNARATKDVAEKYAVAFFDMETAYSDLVNNQGFTIDDLLTDDFVHKTTLGYKLLGDLTTIPLMNSDLQIKDNTVVPFVRSAYVNHNITGVGNAAVPFGRYLQMRTDESGYLKFSFIVTQKNYDLILMSMLTNEGGQLRYKLDGEYAGTIDFFVPGITLVSNFEYVLAKNLSVGFHTIEFNSADLTVGQYTSVPALAYLNGVRFEHNIPTADLMYKSSLITLPMISYKTLINRIAIKNTKTTQALSLVGNYLHAGAKTFHIKARFSAGFGINWFAKDANQIGYQLRFHTGKIILERGGKFINDGLSGGVEIGLYENSSLDYSKEHEIRIEHNSDGSIKVYFNNTLVISAVDTTYKSGFCGFYAMLQNVSATISEFKYADGIL